MNYPQPGQQFPGYPPQQVQPQYPAYPQQAHQFPQQQAFQPPQQQAPTVPLAQGSIDDYYGQPATGGGPSISWNNKPIGTTYGGIVARDVTNADIQQQTNFQTKQPEFYRDGRPKFVMKVPLQVEPSQEFPEGEATLFVRGRMRDELVRAMGEAGVQGAPQAGALLVVSLVGKKPSGQGLNPANVFQIQYQAPAGAVATSPAPAPQAPVQAEAQQPVNQFQPQVQQTPQPVAPQQFQQQAPAAQPAAPQAPADFDAEQRALLARLSGQQAS